MADLFPVLKSIRGKHPLPVSESLTPPPFLVNKWLSFHSPELCWMINSVANDKLGVLTPDEHVAFLTIVLPKMPLKTLKYIKRPKVEKKKREQGEVEKLASLLEISHREAKSYIELVEYERHP